MSKFLFKVADVFQITRGLVVQADRLYDDLDQDYGAGGRLMLTRPDGSTVETDSWIERFVPSNFGRPACVLVERTLSKTDVPVGTEVWLL